MPPVRSSVIATPSAPRPRRLYRSADERLVAGVAGGLAGHVGVDPLAVRIAFALLATAGGLGILLYAAFWVVVPLAPSVGRADPAPRAMQLGSLLALAVGAMLLAAQAGIVFDSAESWSLLATSAGVALIWRQADEAQRARWVGLGRRTGPAASSDLASAARLAVGAVLFVGGLTAFLAATDELRAAREGLVAIVIVLAGAALVFGPWSLRLVAELSEERRERIRSEERAALASHVHDSVLQTLSLIQRAADDPREVQRLARTQERELRSWLYGMPAAARAETLSAALEYAAAEVEDRHDVRVETVAVGDAPLDDRLSAVVLAAREAMVNAAKFSGDRQISLFAEVEPDVVTVFVRDTGAGFDLDAVAADRRGLADSIIGRVQRAGGTARVRTAPGEGTEVELAMPRGPS